MSATLTAEIFEFEEFRLIPSEGLLLRNGAPVSLNPKAFAVLEMLVVNHGHLVTKGEILEAIWQGAYIEEAAVSKAVWFARNALGDTSKEKYITTIPTRGYRFIASVSRVNDVSATYAITPRTGSAIDGEGDAQELESRDHNFTFTGSTSAPAESASSPTRLNIATEGRPTRAGLNRFLTPQRSWILFAAAATILFAGLSLYFVSRDRTRSGLSGSTRIAVLPVKPLDVGSRNSAYDLGIAEALILKLGSRKELVVSPLSAVRGYVDVNADPLAAGREQNADFVLSSNYQITGGRIKVTAQLLEVGTGNVADTFKAEQPVDPSFAAQDAIAAAIGNSLLKRFGPDAGDTRASRGTESQEAYRLYMMAMNLSEERGILNLRKALEYLERAVESDPNYAQAWAGIAHLHRDIVGHGDPDSKGHYEKSIAAIRTALSIDPNLSNAYSALCGNKSRYEYDMLGAEAACRRALELDPGSPLAHKTYANFLYSRGRFDEAILHIKTATDLQPISYRNQQIYGLTLFYARRYDEAATQFKRLLELNPNHAFIYGQLATILHLQGKDAEAFQFLVKGLLAESTDDLRIERYKKSFAESGWKGLVREQIKSEAEEASPFRLACLYAEIGDKDRAFGYLEKAYAEHSFLISVLRVTPQLDPLRDDPRFDSLVDRIGLR